MATERELIQAAQKAAPFAYAPHSNIFVGAAVSFFGTDCIYTGCNVESSSYGLTMCAERAAICAGVSAGHRNISRVALAMYDSSGAPLTASAKVVPCGACLQFIAEFSRNPAFATPKILIADAAEYTLSDLLPHQFSLQFKSTAN